MSKVQKSLKEKNNYSDRVPLIGAGTGVMVMCLLLVLGYQSLRQPKVAIERRVETSGTLNEKRLPAVSTIVDSQAALGLSESQVEKLQTLQEDQSKALSPIEKQLTEIMSPLKNTDGSGTTMSMNQRDIQMIAKQISDPSRRKREIEKGFSKLAWEELTHDQQEKALRLSLSLKPFMAANGEDKR
ncbi:MAG: hypothetical protein C0507_23580 [Cyanobacteria bacterium PR.3.49]|nr:hypothetical protein [Cyanobacteria bacterium PR.3.49]